jgi:3-hydroxyacyl-CoA dehydrogenase/enoyl-CoA hydratase/3-hydroxybutyryl-CoA epimerase
VGFPDFRGGPLQYARSLGLTSVVQRLQKLAEVHGQRFAPCRQWASQ